jgi:hypothetical protein
VSMTIRAFWNILPWSLIGEDRHFRGAYCDIFGVSSDTRRQLSLNNENDVSTTRNNGSRRNNGFVAVSITMDLAVQKHYYGYGGVINSSV